MNPTVENWKDRLGSLDAGEDDAEAVWDELASRRVRDIRDGAAPGRDAADFLAELRERYP